MGLSLVLLTPHRRLALSYGSFNELRESIAEVAGTKIPQFIGDGTIKQQSHFYELMNHSDCDGTLDGAESKNLIKDFKAFDSAFKTKHPELYEFYQELYELLAECVEENGIIVFR